MHELTQHLNMLQSQNKTLVIPYLMAGDGGFEKTAQLIKLYEDSGASAIEIGIPFSDPVADGPVIEAAGVRALAGETTLDKILQFLSTLPKPKVPRIIMTYLNPVLRMGPDAFFEKAVQGGVSGVIIPDMPLEEIDICLSSAKKTGIALIPLATPQTTPERFKELEQVSDGFVYAVTVNGVTGTRNALPEDLKKRLKELQTASKLPVIAGFGISNCQQMKELKPYCDGFVIGSALVDLAYNNDFEKIGTFLKEASSL